MLKTTYDEFVQRIAKASGLSEEEIKRRVEAKRAVLSGLISKEGAAQVVASELGVSFEDQLFKISDLLIGMKKVRVEGKVIEVYPIRKYRKSGKENEFGTLLLGDETSSIRVVLWDTKHLAMIKEGKLKKGSVVAIKGADVRGTTVRELHLGSGSELELIEKAIEVKSEHEELPFKRLDELKPGDRAAIRAFIVQIFQPNFFHVCPECGMRTSFEENRNVCVRHGPIIPKKRVLDALILDDGTETIRAIAFNEIAAALFNLKPEEVEKLQELTFFDEKKQQLLGQEFKFSGRTRKNVLFDRNEFVIEQVEPLTPEKLIQELQRRQGQSL